MPTLKGTEVSLSYVQCFLYLVSSINVSIFHITWLDTFWTDFPFNKIKRNLSCRKKTKFDKEDNMSIATSPNPAFLVINTKFRKDATVQLAGNELYKLPSILPPKLLKTSRATGQARSKVSASRQVMKPRYGLGCHLELGWKSEI